MDVLESKGFNVFSIFNISEHFYDPELRILQGGISIPFQIRGLQFGVNLFLLGTNLMTLRNSSQQVLIAKIMKTVNNLWLLKGTINIPFPDIWLRSEDSHQDSK